MPETTRAWWPRSVRRGTALATLLLCLAVFGLGWLGLREFVRLQLDRRAEQTTLVELNRLADAYRLGPTALATAQPGGDALYEVVTDGGSVVRSPSLAKLDPAWTGLPPAPGDAPADWTGTGQATLRPGKHPHWREYRTYTVLSRVVEDVPAALVEPLGRESSTPEGGLAPTSDRVYRVTVHLFVLPWDTHLTLGLFDDTLAFFVPLAALLAGLAAWLAAGRALRPVEAIRRELARVPGRLDHRVPVPATGDEIARLAVTTNDTLARLQHSHERQERFVADASHELRSPLASLRTGLEVALAHSGRADWPAVAQRSLQDVQRLQRITADLLQLATGAQGPATEVDLAEVVTEQVAERAHDDGPAVRAVLPGGPAVVLGEGVQLERLLRNLLDNAVRHARAAVEVHLAHDRGELVLEVRDDGPGIPPADRERVFDRFARLDDARTRDAGGSGLGLTLARDIATRHGGSLVAADSPAGARLVARFPAAT
ncbi:signal transduction histidine kinase [Crossiella equi]|uniref:histidine kinase n=1 Tax=Crossiella equi TaxID=130796 RepID=A0ABS5AT88_9PSEU|nr:HAMP domain-containing sensor histidine kinase [Crossiella equi]MBP2478915.1 signal transduction histidine kinase [Crossiella equi]